MFDESLNSGHRKLNGLAPISVGHFPTTKYAPDRSKEYFRPVPGIFHASFESSDQHSGTAKNSPEATL
jgi:hypothetical protein